MTFDLFDTTGSVGGPGNVLELDDEELVEKMPRGEQRAFRIFYRRYARYVAGVVYRILGTDRDLDDLVQETFVEALSSLDGLRDPRRLRPWVATIAARQVYRLLIRRKKGKKVVLQARSLPQNHTNSHDGEFALTVYRAMELLPAKERIAWVMHRIEGETLPETARILDVSLATVKRRVARADQVVRRRLGNEG